MNFVKYNFESLIMSPFLKSQFVYFSLSLCMTFLQVSVSLPVSVFISTHIHNIKEKRRRTGHQTQRNWSMEE